MAGFSFTPDFLGLQGGPVAVETVPVVQPSELKPGEALVRVMCEFPLFSHASRLR